MSKNTRSQSPIREGVLLKRAHLEKIRRHERLHNDTQRAASNLIRRATKEAESLRQQAFCQAYCDGVLAASAAVLRFLDDSNRLVGEIQKLSQQRARAMLTEALEHPEAMLTVLDEWLKKHQDRNSQSVLLKLPRMHQSVHQRVKETLRQTWEGPVDMHYHDDLRLLIRCGDTVAEFNPSVITETTSLLPRQDFDQLLATCSQLSDDATMKLQELLMTRFGASTAAPLSPLDTNDCPPQGMEK